MSLQNLQRIGRLQTHRTDRAAVQKLLASARRNLADAQIASVSDDNRFDAAYKTIMECAMLGLWASGFRTATSQPGHHQTALQCLPLTLGIPADSVIVLDALRRQRNLSDYEGDPVSKAVLMACIEEAVRLLVLTADWLQAQHPKLA